MSLARSAVLALPVLVVACQPAQRPEGITEQRSKIDFPTGSLRGEVLWRGAPLTGVGATTAFVYVEGFTGNYIEPDGSYAFASFAPGSYDVGVYANGCAATPVAKLGGVTATVVAGADNVTNIDITPTAGRLVGRITMDGVPLRFPGVTVPDLCSAGRVRTSDADGNFSLLFPPGTYTAQVAADSGVIGSLTFTISAGEVTDLGSVNFVTGSLRGEVLWRGAPLTGVGATTAFVYVGGITGNYIEPDGSYAFASFAPGTYDVSVYANGCAGAREAKLGGVTATVVAGADNVANIDITPTAGRLVGRITMDGVPLSFPSVTVPDLCSAGRARTSDAAGNFSLLFPPGTYTARVAADSGVIGSLTFTISAGEVTDLGPVNFVTGSLRGEVLWRGAPLTGVGATTAFVYVEGFTGNYIESDGSYAFASFAPGSYDIGVYANGCAATPVAKLGGVTATVVAGADNVANIDITPTAGRLVGRITMNGAPLSFPSVTVPDLCSAGRARTSDADGNFSLLFPPGTYTAQVASDSGVIGSFPFGILAGQITEVDSVTTPMCDDTTTPKCSEIPTELNGGLAKVDGLSLTFSTVDRGGHTTVVKSGSCVPACAPPPSGFEVVGARYWDIDTTASHAGPITVCIHYDRTKLMGDEDNLSLMHDDGTGWAVITGSLCKSDGCAAKSNPCEPCTTPAIICGVARSFSPFAIMEPVRAPDTTPPAFAGVPGTVTAYATSTKGALVSYVAPTAVDDVDGPTSVSCTPASGSQFPPGQTTVTCNTADTSGNPNSVSFVVWVQYQAPADGSFFLKPIRADGSSVFKIGRPVPVKFRLTGTSEGITDLRARLTVTKISDQIRGTADDESDEDGDETDFLFKYRKAKGIYAYRWKTSDQTRGTYRLRAELGDGVVHEINVSLKARR